MVYIDSSGRGKWWTAGLFVSEDQACIKHGKLAATVPPRCLTQNCSITAREREREGGREGWRERERERGGERVYI